LPDVPKSGYSELRAGRHKARCLIHLEDEDQRTIGVIAVFDGLTKHVKRDETSSVIPGVTLGNPFWNIRVIVNCRKRVMVLEIRVHTVQ